MRASSFSAAAQANLSSTARCGISAGYTPSLATDGDRLVQMLDEECRGFVYTADDGKYT